MKKKKYIYIYVTQNLLPWKKIWVCVCLRLCERERDCLVLTCLRVEKERKKVPHVLWSTPSFEGQMGAVCVGV